MRSSPAEENKEGSPEPVHFLLSLTFGTPWDAGEGEPGKAGRTRRTNPHPPLCAAYLPLPPARALLRHSAVKVLSSHLCHSQGPPSRIHPRASYSRSSLQPFPRPQSSVPLRLKKSLLGTQGHAQHNTSTNQGPGCCPIPVSLSSPSLTSLPAKPCRFPL